MMENASNVSGAGSSGESGSYEDPEDTEELKAAKRTKPTPSEVTYTERDIMLYNLGIGAKADELPWVYENSYEFAVSYQRSRRIYN
jgi:multifunctional beta-oxidation protein